MPTAAPSCPLAWRAARRSFCRPSIVSGGGGEGLFSSGACRVDRRRGDARSFLYPPARHWRRAPPCSPSVTLAHRPERGGRVCLRWRGRYYRLRLHFRRGCTAFSTSKGVVGRIVPLFSSSRGGGRRIVLRLALGRWYSAFVPLPSLSRGSSGRIVPRHAVLGRWRFVFVLPPSNSRGGRWGIALRSVILGRWRRLVFAPPSSNTRGGSGGIVFRLVVLSR